MTEVQLPPVHLHHIKTEGEALDTVGVPNVLPINVVAPVSHSMTLTANEQCGKMLSSPSANCPLLEHKLGVSHASSPPPLRLPPRSGFY